MTRQKNSQRILSISLKFLGVSIGILTIAALISLGILSLTGEFTYWALVPIVVSFPLTLYLNMRITKKTIEQITKSYIVSEEEPTGEEIDEAG